MGEGPIEDLLIARGEKPFADLFDLCSRTDPRKVNRRALEALIKILETAPPLETEVTVDEYRSKVEEVETLELEFKRREAELTGPQRRVQVQVHLSRLERETLALRNTTITIKEELSEALKAEQASTQLAEEAATNLADAEAKLQELTEENERTT